MTKKNVVQNVKKNKSKRFSKRQMIRLTHRKFNKPNLKIITKTPSRTHNSKLKNLNIGFLAMSAGGPITPPEKDFVDNNADDNTEDANSMSEITSSSIPDEIVSPNKEEIDEFAKRMQKSQASRKIGDIIIKNITNRKTIKKKAMNTIGKFFKNVNPDKRRAYFLKSICSDSGVCIAFGKEANTIKKHFDNFTNFKYLIGFAKTIGAVSANGFVKELTYENEGYKANAILKSSAKRNSDNLIYEAYVGNYLNRVGLQYPCFLETYGTFQYNTKFAYNQMKSDKMTPVEIVDTWIELVKDINTNLQVEKSCTTPLYSAVLLIQHLKDVKDLDFYLTNASFLEFELMYVLFQVYAPLAILANTFTHYDLHTKNILLYEPVKGAYIEYHYNIKGRTFSFKSRYIVKIIDYGRCFFEDDENHTFSGSSLDIYNKLCSTQQCDPNCGEDDGFSWLEYLPGQEIHSYYISSQIRNKSHDLRALKIISRLDSYYLNKMPNDLQDILQKVYYKMNYGTPESVSGLPNNIRNVTDVLKSLFIINKPENISKNNTFFDATFTKLGNLYIFDDGKPMKYEPMV